MDRCLTLMNKKIYSSIEKGGATRALLTLYFTIVQGRHPFSTGLGLLGDICY